MNIYTYNLNPTTARELQSLLRTPLFTLNDIKNTDLSAGTVFMGASKQALSAASQLLAQNPCLRLVMIADSDVYCYKAFCLGASGYLIRPFVPTEVEGLARRLKLSPDKMPEVYIRTFPNFDVYVDGKLLVFRRSKVKELLAFLVDRNGSAPTRGQVVAALWENRPDDSRTAGLYRTTCFRLNDFLNKNGISALLSGSRGARYINKSAIHCDYFDFLQGMQSLEADYHGEYMSEYAWAENTNARLAWQSPYAGK